MAGDVTGLDASDRAVLKDLIREVFGRPPAVTKVTRRVGDRPTCWCTLTSAMTAGTLSAPSSFTFNVWVPDPSDMSDPPAFIESTDPDSLDLPGVNRSSVTGSSGDELKLELVGGEWSPVKPDGVVGGGSGGGCGCCNCMDCLSDEQALVTDCGSCADDAAEYYTFLQGNWVAYPDLGGNQAVFHDSGCTWQSKDDITVTDPSSSSSSASGTYKWVADLSVPSVYLVNTGGTDVLDLAAHPVVYTAIAEEFNCRCESRFHATNAYKFPSPLGLLCDICLTPQYDQYACADITPTFIADNPTMKLKIISSFWGASVCGSSTITLTWDAGAQQWTSGTISCSGTSWIFTCGCGAATGTWAGGWFVRVQFTNGTGTCDYRTYWISGLRPFAPAILAIQGGSYELKTSGGCGAPAGTDIIMKLTWP